MFISYTCKSLVFHQHLLHKGNETVSVLNEVRGRSRGSEHGVQTSLYDVTKPTSTRKTPTEVAARLTPVSLSPPSPGLPWWPRGCRNHVGGHGAIGGARQPSTECPHCQLFNPMLSLTGHYSPGNPNFHWHRVDNIRPFSP